MSGACTGVPPPDITHGYLAVPGTDTLQYMCDDMYSMVGSSIKNCVRGLWVGDVSCEFKYLDDVWFWLIIALCSLSLVALSIALCVCCIRRCCRKSRIRPPPQETNTPRDKYYSNLCCVDYYGCCSLFGCCGIRGCCACCFGCWRCCREPGEGPGISSLPVSILRHRGKKQKRRSPKAPIIIVVNEKQRKGKFKKARVPVIPMWMPHTNSIRNINTSTR